MTSFTSTTSTTIPASARSKPQQHARLHKRGGSGSSLPGLPSPLQSAFTPFATQHEDPFPDISMATAPTNSTPKIKPYLRKMSNAKEDQKQGRIDLSKSTSENNALAGLGIQDFAAAAPRSVSEVAFLPAGRRTAHTRATSVGSQMSTASGSYRANQPFVHPMRQTPRPYTPPVGQSQTSSMKDDEADEGEDTVTEDDLQLGYGFRSRRSMSIPSTPQMLPTPLSQSHTASDLSYIIPKLTSSSQTNLSIKSTRSTKSSKSKLLRSSRRDTERSFEFGTSPSTRSSLDKALSFVPRRSDLDPYERDERIKAARRKFDEKEASKERKLEKEAAKRRESEEAKASVIRHAAQRQKSDTAVPTRMNPQRGKEGGGRIDSRKQEVGEKPGKKGDVRTHGALRQLSGDPEKKHGQKADARPVPSSGERSGFKGILLCCGGNDD